jgi:flagellar biosynthetic protein FliO
MEPVSWYRSGLTSLVIVLAAIAGVTLLVRRLLPSMRNVSGGVVEILGRNHLSPKQSLALVRIGRRLLLVGITPERLSTLCEIDEPQEVADLLGRAPRRANEGENFDELLSGAARVFEEAEAASPRSRAHDSTMPELRSSYGRLNQAKGQLQGLLSKLKALQEP